MHMIKLRRRQNELRSVIVFTQACVKVFFFSFFWGRRTVHKPGAKLPPPQSPKSQNRKIPTFKNSKIQKSESPDTQDPHKPKPLITKSQHPKIPNSKKHQILKSGIPKSPSPQIRKSQNQKAQTLDIDPKECSQGVPGGPHGNPPREPTGTHNNFEGGKTKFFG